MSAPAFTMGPWFGPHYNDTAEPTRALTGKLKPRGHETLNDYHLRVEVSGENVFADANLIAAAPELFEALEAICSSFPNDAPALFEAHAALAKARGEEAAK